MAMNNNTRHISCLRNIFDSILVCTNALYWKKRAIKTAETELLRKIHNKKSKTEFDVDYDNSLEKERH